MNGSNIATGNIADDFVGGIRSILDNIVGGLLNIGGSGFGSQRRAGSVPVQRARAGGSRRRAERHVLPAVQPGVQGVGDAGGVRRHRGGHSVGRRAGCHDTDDFERTSSSSLGALWLQTYSGGGGTWAIPNGHDATFATSGGGRPRSFCVSATIRRSHAAAPTTSGSPRNSPARRHGIYDALLGTFNFAAATTSGCGYPMTTTSLANITGHPGQVVRGRRVDHSPVRLRCGNLVWLGGAGFIVPPGPGAQLIGEAGSLADGAPLMIRAKIGASIRLQANSSLTPGSTRRRWGHGGLAEGHLLPLPGQQKPGGAHFWNGMDQTL